MAWSLVKRKYFTYFKSTLDAELTGLSFFLYYLVFINKFLKYFYNVCVHACQYTH